MSAFVCFILVMQLHLQLILTIDYLNGDPSAYSPFSFGSGDSFLSPNTLVQLRLTARGNLLMQTRPSDTSDWEFNNYFKISMDKDVVDYVKLQNDGNLVVFDTSDDTLWTSNSIAGGTAPFRLIITDDVEAYILDSSDNIVWGTIYDSDPSLVNLQKIWTEPFNNGDFGWSQTHNRDVTFGVESNDCPNPSDPCLEILADGGLPHEECCWARAPNTDITMYSAIQLQVDVAAVDMESSDVGEACRIYWEILDNGNSDGWVMYDTTYTVGVFRDIIIDIPLPDSYTDIRINLQISGDNSNDMCFFDNLILRGVPTDDSITSPPMPSPTPAPTLDATPPPTPNPAPYPTKGPTPNPAPYPTKGPTPNPTQRPTLNPTKYPTNKPTNKPTPNPTNKPTTVPSLSPTHDPSTDPTPRPSAYPTHPPSVSPSHNPSTAPTKNPSTPSPTAPGDIFCGEQNVIGQYNGQMLEFTVIMQHPGDMSFDMSSSSFEVTVMEVYAFDNQRALLETDFDGDQVIELPGIAAGKYVFKIYGAAQTGLIYHVRTICTTNHPTPAPTNPLTNHPTFAPTHDPTDSPSNDPTKSPITSSPTKPPSPTVSPTNDPTQNPTFPTVFPTLNPTLRPTVPTISPTERHTRDPTVPPTITTNESESDEREGDDFDTSSSWMLWAVVSGSVVILIVLMIGLIACRKYKQMASDEVVSIKIGSGNRQKQNVHTGLEHEPYGASSDKPYMVKSIISLAMTDAVKPQFEPAMIHSSSSVYASSTAGHNPKTQHIVRHQPKPQHIVRKADSDHMKRTVEGNVNDVRYGEPDPTVRADRKRKNVKTTKGGNQGQIIYGDEYDVDYINDNRKPKRCHTTGNVPASEFIVAPDPTVRDNRKQKNVKTTKSVNHDQIIYGDEYDVDYINDYRKPKNSDTTGGGNQDQIVFGDDCDEYDVDYIDEEWEYYE